MLSGYECEILLQVYLEEPFAFSRVCGKRINFSSEDDRPTIVPKRVVSVNK